jgi:colicin import membrane protein
MRWLESAPARTIDDGEKMKPAMNTVTPMRRPLLSACAPVAAAMLVSALLAACAGNAQAPREVPPPPVTSVAQADTQLAAVARERAAIEARYAERERACYDKFFVNNCLDEAKEQRRIALAAQRAIEVQAAHFKRAAVVEDRERQMVEAEKRYQEQEARMAAEPPKPPRQVTPPPAPPKPSDVPQRIAERDARLRDEAAKEAADAGKRAQSAQAYEQRKAESAERQRRVAEKKAERAAKAAKEAAEAAEKAKAAAQQAK